MNQDWGIVCSGGIRNWVNNSPIVTPIMHFLSYSVGAIVMESIFNLWWRVASGWGIESIWRGWGRMHAIIVHICVCVYVFLLDSTQIFIGHLVEGLQYWIDWRFWKTARCANYAIHQTGWLSIVQVGNCCLPSQGAVKLHFPSPWQRRTATSCPLAILKPGLHFTSIKPPNILDSWVRFVSALSIAIGHGQLKP